jgi:hypothetical protein
MSLIFHIVIARSCGLNVYGGPASEDSTRRLVEAEQTGAASMEQINEVVSDGLGRLENFKEFFKLLRRKNARSENVRL